MIAHHNVKSLFRAALLFPPLLPLHSTGQVTTIIRTPQLAYLVCVAQA